MVSSLLDLLMGFLVCLLMWLLCRRHHNELAKERKKKEEFRLLLKELVDRHPVAILQFLALLANNLGENCRLEVDAQKRSFNLAVDDPDLVLEKESRRMALFQENIRISKRHYWDRVETFYGLGLKIIPRSFWFFINNPEFRDFWAHRAFLNEEAIYDAIRKAKEGLYEPYIGV